MAKVNRRLPSPKPQRDFSVFRRVFIVLKITALITCGLGVLGVVGFYGFQTANQFLNRPIAQIVVNGHFQYVSRKEVRSRIESILGASFISENIHLIQKDVESMPWVDVVSLSRSWPDTLNITVDEHAPIARWGSKGFVNVRGELVFTDNIDALSQLPELSGSASDVIQIMEKYSVLARVFQQYDMEIHYLQQDARQSWRLDLSNGWRVIFGRDDVLEKANRLIHLLDAKLIETTADISTIDIRYPNGISVKWNQADEDSNTVLVPNDSKNIVWKQQNSESLSSSEKYSNKKYNKVSHRNYVYGQEIELSHAQYMTHTRG